MTRVPPVDAQSAENDRTNIHIHTHNCTAIDKSRSCMGVVVAAIVPTAAVDKVGVSPSIIN